MRIAILTTETDHHTYFINSINKFFKDIYVVYETRKLEKPYKTGPFFDKEDKILLISPVLRHRRYLAWIWHLWDDFWLIVCRFLVKIRFRINKKTTSTKRTCFYRFFCENGPKKGTQMGPKTNPNTCYYT